MTKRDGFAQGKHLECELRIFQIKKEKRKKGNKITHSPNSIRTQKSHVLANCAKSTMFYFYKTKNGTFVQTQKNTLLNVQKRNEIPFMHTK